MSLDPMKKLSFLIIEPNNMINRQGSPGVELNEWVASNRIPLLYAKGPGIATGQTMQIATKKCMAKSCFGVQKNNF